MKVLTQVVNLVAVVGVRVCDSFVTADSLAKAWQFSQFGDRLELSGHSLGLLNLKPVAVVLRNLIIVWVLWPFIMLFNLLTLTGRRRLRRKHTLFPKS